MVAGGHGGGHVMVGQLIYPGSRDWAAGKRRRTEHVHEVGRGEKEGGGVDPVAGDRYVGEGLEIRG